MHACSVRSRPRCSRPISPHRGPDRRRRSGRRRLSAPRRDGRPLRSELHLGAEDRRRPAQAHAAVVRRHLMIVEPEHTSTTFARPARHHHLPSRSDPARAALAHAHPLARRQGRHRDLPADAGRDARGLIEDCDQILIMSVNPGFGGQRFIERSLEKLREARALIDARNPACDLEVDGGVGARTSRASSRPAPTCVMGSSDLRRDRPGGRAARAALARVDAASVTRRRPGRGDCARSSTRPRRRRGACCSASATTRRCGSRRARIAASITTDALVEGVHFTRELRCRSAMSASARWPRTSAISRRWVRGRCSPPSRSGFRPDRRRWRASLELLSRLDSAARSERTPRSPAAIVARAGAHDRDHASSAKCAPRTSRRAAAAVPATCSRVTGPLGASRARAGALRERRLR